MGVSVFRTIYNIHFAASDRAPTQVVAPAGITGSAGPARRHRRPQRPCARLVAPDGPTDDAGTTRLAQGPVELGARADIDALRRLVRQDDRRLQQQRPGHHDLLLVAT